MLYARRKKPEDAEYVSRFVSNFEAEIGNKVLIFGASNRNLVEQLVQRNKQVTLLDIRSNAFNKFDGLQISKKLVLENDEFAGIDKHDTVIFFDTLHHARDKRKTVADCSGVLREKGTVLCYEPNIFTKLTREHDQFGELKHSIYKLRLIKLFQKYGFAVELHSSEQLQPRERPLKRLIVLLQKLTIDPIFRILLVATKSAPV